MKKKKLKFDNDLEFAKVHVLVVATLASLKLTPQEILCLAGLVVIAKSNQNILSPRSKRLLGELIGLNKSNVRSLTDRLISKGIIIKKDRGEGNLIQPFRSDLNLESYEIQLERLP